MADAPHLSRHAFFRVFALSRFRDLDRRGRLSLYISVALLVIALMAVVVAPRWWVRPPEPPLGLAPVEWPRDNPYSPAKAELGRRLFFDKRLSSDDTVACASCHQPRLGFTDGRPVAVGVREQKGRRSAPSVLNRAYSMHQFWDGRAPSLEAQAKESIANPIEMDLPHAASVAKLRAIPDYRRRFRQVFGTEEFSIDHIVKAIATYERTLLSGASDYDRYQAGDRQALSPSAQRGVELFFGKALCNSCHSGPNFTDETFANSGIGLYRRGGDWGRWEITHQAHDRGVFKIPTLRDVARTAPYMHDGSLPTLEKVVEYYDKGGNNKLAGGTPNPILDERMQPLRLTRAEKADLAAFLKALTGRSEDRVTR